MKTKNSLIIIFIFYSKCYMKQMHSFLNTNNNEDDDEDDDKVLA